MFIGLLKQRFFQSSERKVQLTTSYQQKVCQGVKDSSGQVSDKSARGPEMGEENQKMSGCINLQSKTEGK